MARGSKVGGTKRRIKDAVGFLVIIALFLLYMIPFLMVLINSFKQKRDIIKNPFSLITEKGFTFDNYIKAFEKMQFVKAFGNSLFITGLSTLLVILLASMVAFYFTRAKHVFQGAFCIDGGIHDYSVPGDHDSAGIDLRLRVKYFKSQTDACVHAHRVCDEYVGLYLSGLY